MGLFRSLGRRAERFTQQLSAAATDELVCADCGTTAAADLERCPACGGDDLVEEA